MKKNKKQTAPHIVITSELGLEAAINKYVETSLTLLRRQAKQEREIATLSARHAKDNREDLEDVLALETGIQLFATTNRALLYPDESVAKSKAVGNATIGFRLSPEALEKIVPKDTWERIAERLDALPWGEKYVEQSLSVDKKAMHKDRADLTAAQLAEAGVKFAQEEKFFLEPDSQLLEAARKPVVETESEAVA
jgi:hypothetical protein